MGRSVSYLSNAETVIYFTVKYLNEENENGEIDYELSQMNYDDFMRNLTCEIKSKLKSYEEVEKYDGRETRIILENRLCSIGISEYCGSWSLSIAPKEENYYVGYYKENLALNHAGQIEETLEKCLVKSGAKILRKIGTMSNGVSVYRYKK